MGRPRHPAKAANALDERYRRLVGRVRQLVIETTPAGAQVAVISNGDPALVALRTRTGLHFPQTADGSYIGYHPHDSIAAIVQLEALRGRGAEYLVIPVSSAWWLDAYPLFKEHLESRYRILRHDQHTGMVIAVQSVAARGRSMLEEAIAEFQRRFQRDPTLLDWGTGVTLPSSHSHCAMAVCPADRALPYLDGTFDVVVTAAASRARIADARRVAAAAVVRVASQRGSRPSADGAVHWQRGLPRVGEVTVSIIVPTFNGISRVRACIRSLEETLHPRFAGEIIVVDDGSAAETRAGLSHLAQRSARVRVLRNRRNLGFVDSCNAGAAAATGDMLVFLNDDTLPLPQWLDWLLGTFRRYPDAGAVGGKLIFPDGLLQEAGGVIYRDGTGANFGKRDPDLENPLYSYVRQVDYCSGALLATPRKLFEALGGFDTRFRPSFYEDTDYCFSVRRQGYSVYYQPECRVIHVEGATAGTDVARGAKRHQDVNRAKFVQKWKAALTQHAAPPRHYDASVWHALSVRPSEEPRRS